jgi:thymidylate kinase
MIIELFGPPGCGKTTLARALGARLRECGHAAEFMHSYRPGERLPSIDARMTTSMRWSVADGVRRLARPVLELLTMRLDAVGEPHDTPPASKLLAILPPKNIVLSIRLRQYLARLAHSWHRASRTGTIVVFDQAFVQAVYSLALFSQIADETRIAQALDAVPKPDLLVRINASREVLETRLRDRLRLQNVFERLFEVDVKTTLNSIEIIDHLDDLLCQRGREVTYACCLNQDSLTGSVGLVEQQVMMKLGPERARITC